MEKFTKKIQIVFNVTSVFQLGLHPNARDLNRYHKLSLLRYHVEFLWCNPIKYVVSHVKNLLMLISTTRPVVGYLLSF